MRIIGADERLNEPPGVKLLLIGPTGVGKTSQLRTLDPISITRFCGNARHSTRGTGARSCVMGSSGNSHGTRRKSQSTRPISS
jgi:hypothetical protein